MKVALSIEVTDQQRNALAVRLSGKEVKRLATRDEVRDFLLSALTGLDTPGTTEPLPTTHSDPVPGVVHPPVTFTPDTGRPILGDPFAELDISSRAVVDRLRADKPPPPGP